MPLARKTVPQSPADIHARLSAELESAQAAVAALDPLGPLQLAAARGEPGAADRLASVRATRRAAIEAVENAQGAIEALEQSERDGVEANRLAEHAAHVAQCRKELDAKNADAAVVSQHVEAAMRAWESLLAHNSAAHKAWTLAGGKNAPGKLFDHLEMKALLGGLFYRLNGKALGWPGSRRTHMKNTTALDAEPPMTETLARTAKWVCSLIEHTEPPVVLAAAVPSELAPADIEEPAASEAAPLTAEQALAIQPKGRRLPGTGGGAEFASRAK
jgi:hypothetical protein